MDTNALPDNGIVVSTLTVKPEWLDYNQHMNVAYYVFAFDLAIDDLKDTYGLTEAYRLAQQCSTVALEAHITYQNEATLDEVLRIESRILDTDGKRLHLAQAMYRDTTLLATQETLSISFDLQTRRARPFDPALLQRIQALQQAQLTLPRPSWAGRIISLASGKP
jgi:acyl-CoA thioester hydrolase